jgi:hypothetical protein
VQSFGCAADAVVSLGRRAGSSAGTLRSRLSQRLTVAVTVAERRCEV